MRKFLLSLATAGVLFISGTSLVSAAVPSFCDQIVANRPPVCDDIQNAPGQNPVIKTISSAVNVLSLAIGFASVVMIIVGGIRYTMSSGDQARVKSAKDTVLFSVIGIVVALSAQLIVVFILNKL